MLTDWTPFPGHLPDEQIFVMGDVHGRSETFGALVEDIARLPHSGQPRRFVSAGDVNDRGPGSIAAAHLLMTLPDRLGLDHFDLLPGNHELAMLEGLLDPVAMQFWLRIGGMSVLEEADPEGTVSSVLDAAPVISKAYGPEYLEAIRSGPDHLWVGDLLVVHAGILPTTDLAANQAFLDQGRRYDSEQHWAWIRDPFLDHTGSWDPDDRVVVAHGHTPVLRNARPAEDYFRQADLVETHRRLNLDAGAAAGERIGWAEFRGGDAPVYRMGITRRDRHMMEA